MRRRVKASASCGVQGVNVENVLFRCRMKPRIVQYTPSYFGVTLNKKQLRILRRIASDRAEPIGLFIRGRIQHGFDKLEKYTFSEGN